MWRFFAETSLDILWVMISLRIFIEKYEKDKTIFFMKIDFYKKSKVHILFATISILLEIVNGSIENEKVLEALNKVRITGNQAKEVRSQENFGKQG